MQPCVWKPLIWARHLKYKVVGPTPALLEDATPSHWNNPEVEYINFKQETAIRKTR